MPSLQHLAAAFNIDQSMLMDNEEFVNVNSELPVTVVLEDKEILEVKHDDREDENGECR